MWNASWNLYAHLDCGAKPELVLQRQRATDREDRGRGHLSGKLISAVPTSVLNNTQRRTGAGLSAYSTVHKESEPSSWRPPATAKNNERCHQPTCSNDAGHRVPRCIKELRYRKQTYRSDAVHCSVGVLDRLDAVEHDTSVPLLAHKNAISVHEQKVTEQPSRSHANPRINAQACLSPAASQTESIKVGRECWALLHEAATAHPLHEDRVGHAHLHAESPPL